VCVYLHGLYVRNMHMYDIENHREIEVCVYSVCVCVCYVNGLKQIYTIDRYNDTHVDFVLRESTYVFFLAPFFPVFLFFPIAIMCT